MFSCTLRYFLDHALRELTDAIGNKVLMDEVRWVVTVPAIWRQQAKQFMREAAYEVNKQPNKIYLEVRNAVEKDPWKW